MVSAVVRCIKCGGDLEAIRRGGVFVFNLCRSCKIPHDDLGRAAVDLNSLNTAFNPLKISRAIIKKTNGDAEPVTRTALEVFLMQGLLEAYAAGLKDGVLLAYSQDVETANQRPFGNTADTN